MSLTKKMTGIANIGYCLMIIAYTLLLVEKLGIITGLIVSTSTIIIILTILKYVPTLDNDKHDELKKVKEDDKPAFQEVSDVPKTFGYILQKHRKLQKEELSVIINRVQENSKIKNILPTDPEWYRQVEEGKQLVKKTSTIIPALSIAYDIELSLLQALAAFPETNIIHLKSQEDFVEIPLLKPEVKKTVHQVPRTKLAGSTTSLVKVILCRNGESLLHQHPGEEIVIMLKGRIRVKFPELTGSLKTVTLSEGEILHFNSNILHQFENADNPISEAMVIRILNEWSLENLVE